MAKTVNTPAEAAPLVGLTEEAKAHLEAIKGELDEAVKDLDAMESLGLDVSRLRDKILWGYKAREVILERLSKK